MSERSFRRGSVFWVDFTGSRGGEIQKVRPAVIVSNDVANRHLNRVQVVPLTSNMARVYPGEAIVEIKWNTDESDGRSSRYRCKGTVRRLHGPTDLRRSATFGTGN